MAAVIRSETGLRQGTRFAWHFIQMFIAMGVGMAALAIGLGLLGYGTLGKRLPEFYALLMALSMVIPMAAWMRFRMGHGWSRASEMSAAMVVPTGGLVVICFAGILPHSAALAWSMPLMYVAMLGDMGYRWRDYAQHRHGLVPEPAHTNQPPAVAITKTAGAISELQGAVR
jgi:hypothetical protein